MHSYFFIVKCLYFGIINVWSLKFIPLNYNIFLWIFWYFQDCKRIWDIQFLFFRRKKFMNYMQECKSILWIKVSMENVFNMVQHLSLLHSSAEVRNKLIMWSKKLDNFSVQNYSYFVIKGCNVTGLRIGDPWFRIPD